MHEHSMYEAPETANWEEVFADLHRQNEVTIALRMSENIGNQILRVRQAIKQGMKVYFGEDCETPSIVRNHDQGIFIMHFVKKPAEQTEPASMEFNGIINQLLKNACVSGEYREILIKMLLATFQYRGDPALLNERIEKILEGESKDRAVMCSALYWALFKEPNNVRLIHSIQGGLSQS